MSFLYPLLMVLGIFPFFFFFFSGCTKKFVLKIWGGGYCLFFFPLEFMFLHFLTFKMDVSCRFVMVVILVDHLFHIFLLLFIFQKTSPMIF